MAIDYDFERSVVCVIVDGKVSGTGVVIAPNKVLTCAHVIGIHGSDKKATKPLAIGFYALHPAIRQGDSTELKFDQGNASSCAQTEPYPVTVDWNFCSSEELNDLVVLTWEGALPSEARVVEMCSDESLADVEIYVRGYPELGAFSSLPAVGKISGRVHHDPTGNAHWAIDSRQITGGFSGGPVFRKDTEKMIGVARAATSPDGNWRLMTTAFAIGIHSIYRFCGELIHGLRQEIELEHQRAIERLRKLMAEQLETSPAACRKFMESLPAIEKSFGASQSKSQAMLVAEFFTSSRMSVQEFVRVVIDCYESCAASSDKLAIAKVYVLVLSAILDPELVREIRAKFVDGERLFVIPYSARPIVEIIMAGVEGRLGRFNVSSQKSNRGKSGRDTSRSLPENRLEVSLAPDRGIVKDNKLDAARMDTLIADTIGVGLKSINPENVRDYLNAVLENRTRKAETIYLIQASDKTRLSDKVVAELRTRYPALMIAELRTQSGSSPTNELQAMIPWLDGELPIVSERRK